MKTNHLATVAIMAMTSSTATSIEIYSAKHRNAFMKAMRTHHRDAGSASYRLSKDQTASLNTFAEEMSGDSKRARNLRKKVLEKAKPVTLGEQQNQNQKKQQQQQHRRLQNNSQANRNYNYYDSNNQASNNQANNNQNNRGSDDYFMAYGEFNNVFGFDVTQYSLSYHRCAAVRQYDDTVAAMEDTDSVFATKRFAVFRFCPSMTCEGIRDESEEDEYAAEEENTFDRLQVGGANGEGCQSSYGEYMLELEDYLALMTEYHEERFGVYCETCKDCMYDVYQQWLHEGGEQRKLKDMTDPSWEAELESDEFQKMHRDLEYDPYHVCPEYDTCQYYKNVCDAKLDDSLSQYFECTQVERSNNRIAYIGPTCSSDGITITLGVFADEYCNEYIGDGVDISNFLGYELDAEELAPYVAGSLSDIIPEEGIQAQQERYSQNYDAELAEYYSPIDNMCIPCMASRQPYEERGNVGDYEDQDQDQHGDADINELCQNLYMVSARCDKHYGGYSKKSNQAKYAEAVAMEDLTCDFIDSIVMENYDENGFVNGYNMNIKRYNSDTQSRIFGDSALWEQYESKVQEVSPFQIVGLVVTIAMCAAMAVWSMHLRASLSKKPAILLSHLMVSRVDSGIMLKRSASNVNTQPLDSDQTLDRNPSYYAP